MTAARVDRVVVGISGSLANMAALHAAVAQARRSDAELVAVLAWSPVGGENRLPPCPLPTTARPMAPASSKHTGQRLRRRLGRPSAESGAHVGPRARRRRSHSGAHRRPARLRHGSVSRYCLAHAHCPVLAVPQPDMISYLRAGRSPWRKHRGAPPAETAHRHGLSGRLT